MEAVVIYPSARKMREKDLPAQSACSRITKFECLCGEIKRDEGALILQSARVQGAVTGLEGKARQLTHSHTGLRRPTETHGETVTDALGKHLFVLSTMSSVYTPQLYILYPHFDWLRMYKVCFSDIVQP